MTAPSGIPRARPLIICGYPKSGTTLLLALLDSHAQLLVLPEETMFFTHVYPEDRRRWLGVLFEQTGMAALSRGRVRAPSGDRDYRAFDFDAFRRGVTKRWSNSPKRGKQFLECVVRAYAETTGQLNYAYWVEKTPGNELHLDRIRTWWSDATAILMVRDPRQALASRRKYQKRKAADRRIEIRLPAFIAQWRESIRAFLRYLDGGGQGLIVRYEDLTADPRSELQRIVAPLRIPFSKSLLTPTKLGVPWAGNASDATPFSGVEPNPKDYDEYLSRSEIVIVEAGLGHLMHRLGYGCHTPLSRRASYCVGPVVELWRRIERRLST